MIWRLVILLSLLPAAAVLAARWWWGGRVLAACDGATVSPDAGKWRAVTGTEPPADLRAGALGVRLREGALEQWRASDPAAARSRSRALTFGMAVPPLAIMVAVLGVMVGRVPVVAGIAVFVAATGLSAFFGLMSVGAELRAVAAAAARLRSARAFPRADDEAAVIACAAAEVWRAATPPILRWVV